MARRRGARYRYGGATETPEYQRLTPTDRRIGREGLARARAAMGLADDGRQLILESECESESESE